MKIFTKKELLPLALILFSFIFGIYFYPSLPGQVATHWNIQGEVDGWSGRNFAVFFLPSLTLFTYLLMLFIPLIDPLRKNYLYFNRAYFWFRVLLVGFLSFLHFFILTAGLGVEMNINLFLVPAYAVLFVFIGLFLPKIKKNYFVGIRTPWTLHSEEVWDKTHRLAGKLFIASGLVILSGLVFPDYVFWFLLISVVITVVGSAGYSYFVYVDKLKK